MDRLSGGREGKPHSSPEGRGATIGRRMKRAKDRAEAATGGRIGKFGGGRTNLLEELGRVEGERSNPNRRAEISRVHGELNRGYAKGGRAGFEYGNKVERKKKFEKEKVTVDPGKRKSFIGSPKWRELHEDRSKYRDWNKAQREKTFGGKRIPKKGPVIRERQNPPSPTVRAPEAQGGRIGFKKGTDKNWIQKATASIKKRGTKGKCTPITKKGCTGRAKALAKTFKKMAAKRKA